MSNTITSNPDEFLFVEKYRPKTIDECILPEDLKKTLISLISANQLPNLMFTGSQGLGKTTVARAICNTLGLDYIMINASEDNGIDILRTKIRQFASTVSLQGSDKPKVVILDEGDYITSAAQPALRGFIEEFSTNCRFILTCNHKNRIIPALHSRFSIVEFNSTKKELAKLAMYFMKRLKKILEIENIKAEDSTLAELIMKHAPDWRKILNECQKYASSGEIPLSVISGLSSESLQELVNMLKEKDFKSMRSWVANNGDVDSSVLFRAIYDAMSDIAQSSSIPVIVLTLADYQFKNAFVSDKELNTAACLTDLMANVQWK